MDDFIIFDIYLYLVVKKLIEKKWSLWFWFLPLLIQIQILKILLILLSNMFC